MKKGFYLFFIILLVFSFTACGIKTEQTENTETSQEKEMTPSENEDTSTQNTEEQITGKDDDNQMKLQIGDDTFTATLADNSSAEALMKMLKEGPITIDMQDYAKMEKVGSLGTSLPRNDQQITTEAGDLILYQGNAFVIYYAPNSWNFTRIGKINDVTAEELKKVLGTGDVKITLSID